MWIIKIDNPGIVNKNKIRSEKWIWRKNKTNWIILSKVNLIIEFQIFQHLLLILKNMEYGKLLQSWKGLII
jgi:hypothetical protein